MKLTRRQVVKYSMVAGTVAAAPWQFGARIAHAAQLAGKLSDPAFQPKFRYTVPNPLDPGFHYTPRADGEFLVGAGPTTQLTGLVNAAGKLLETRVFGYGQGGSYSWPGKTFEILSAAAGGAETTAVTWENNLFGEKHLLPVDTSLHWAYSLHGYEQFKINKDGIPIVVHLHGGHTDFQFDGNPEFFYNPGATIVGPQWDNVPGGFTNRFIYDNDVPAGSLWYHDHALGITRLNVYAGMAGFYFVRDGADTGRSDNPLGLPAFPYEIGLAIQDRMFRKNGALFYPAFPADPFWDDFITGEGLDNDEVPKPSALAEFFGDHMMVNGLIWPKADVEPRHYRLRLLNGCDSRFLVTQFVPVGAGVTDPGDASAGAPLPFYVIGSDQGLAANATLTDTLVHEPGGRYDVVLDFSQVPAGSRVIMKNIGGDAPFGGDFGDALDADDLFLDRQTDRVMAFDVVQPLDMSVADAFDGSAIAFGPPAGVAPTVRRLALFEGTDQYGRLQPLLGTVDAGPNPYGSIATPYTWFQDTTERPALGATEEWEIYNFTGDAHPIHLHLVSFEVLGRNAITFDSDDGDPGQPVFQHTGEEGRAAVVTNLSLTGPVNLGPTDGYVENAPKDVVTALPQQVTRVRTTFDKPGRFVWHCHILSHEDHEMMRVLEVV